MGDRSVVPNIFVTGCCSRLLFKRLLMSYIRQVAQVKLSPRSYTRRLGKSPHRQGWMKKMHQERMTFLDFADKLGLDGEHTCALVSTILGVNQFPFNHTCRKCSYLDVCFLTTGPINPNSRVPFFIRQILNGRMPFLLGWREFQLYKSCYLVVKQDLSY